ncbi:peptidase domain-containing ABC transporter [Aureibaculum algae]|nr:peptidase domain-containing ABC transporter [Aureibaculum algae]
MRIKIHNQQQDQSDCGVVCLKTVLNYFESDSPLERLREYSGTSSNGTTMLGLLQCANKVGLMTKGYEATLDDLKETKEIAILHTVIENELYHYIVCFGYNEKNDTFLISNPSSSKAGYISSKELDIIWQSKALLICKPSEYLPKKKSVRKQKISWLFTYIKEDLNLLSMALLLGVLLAVLSLATAVYSQKLIDVLLPSKDVFKIYASVALLFFLFLVTAFISYIRSIFLIRQSKDFNIRVIGYFYGNLLKLPKSFFDTRKIGDMIARMNDTSRIQRTVANIIGNIMIDILMIFVSTIAIFSYNKMLGYITLFWIPIFTLIVFYFNPKIIKAQRLTMQAYAKNESNYIDTIQGIETIKANNKGLNFSNKTKSVYEFFQTSIYNLGKLGMNFGIANQLISSIFIIVTISFSIYLVLNGSITAGVIIAILQLVGILMGSTSNLAMANIQIQEAKIAIDRMFEFTSLESDSNKGFNIESFQSLEIKTLSFRFAGRSQLLKNINLHIKKGEFVAVVGESGSGKSTLGQIIQQFYPFENGTIIVNNKHELKSISTEHWRNIVGVIPQEINIFSGNVIDNILLGSKDNPENVVKFCQENGFEKFISELPQGFATLLGEEGINLSGGQKQIIALARVLYKKPQFLILDEATSAMDRNTEKFTINLISKLKKDIAVLFISHRLHTLKNTADRIYVLENGIITSQGNHELLLESTNFYSEFWEDLILK